MKPIKYTDSHRYAHGYRKAAATDIRLTFRRVRDERRRNEAERAAKVAALPRKVAK